MNKLKYTLVVFLISLVILIPLINTYLNLNVFYQVDEVEFLIGVSQSNLSEPWHTKLNEDLKKYASNHDNIKLIFTDAAQSSVKQVKDIDRLIDYGIDLLIIHPNDRSGITDKLKKVHSNIPVIVLDRDINKEYYDLLISGDNYKLGLKVGQDIKDLLNNRGGNVVEITGLSGSVSSMQRSKGLRDELCDNYDIIIDKIQCTWIRDDAMVMFKEYLTNSETQVDIVFAHNDEMALGAYKAAKELDYENITFLGIDGLDGNSGGVHMVEEGILEKTYLYPNGAKEAMEYALKLLNGEDLDLKRIELQVIRINSLDNQHNPMYTKHLYELNR